MSVKDPVCGMEIEPQAAFATRQYKGQTFHFCSANCVSKFDAAPEQYALAVPSATTGIADGASGPVRLELPVSGLSRSGGPALAQALQAVPGVRKASVNAGSGRATIEYDPARAKATDFVDAVRAAGFSTDGQSLRLKVSGLYCAECVVKIEDALKATPGVLDATMNAATNEVRVEDSPVIGDLSLLTKAVESAGPYKATRAAEATEPEMDKEAQATEKEYRSLMRKWWFAAAVGVPTMILSYPWIFPVLRDLFPRGSDNLRYVWYAMGVASLAVLAYSGNQSFT